MGDSIITLVPLDPFLHGSPSSADVNFTTFTGYPVTTQPCLVGSTASFIRTKCDLSVVSDLKTALIPFFCRQRRSASDNHDNP